MEHKPGYLVDNVWNCGCGALNAAYLTKCGKCEKERQNKTRSGYIGT